jgi:hypothetical protein
MQGKFVGADTIDAEPMREVLSAWLQLKDLVRLQETGNNKLKMKLAEVAIALDDDYDEMFELLTTGTLTPRRTGRLRNLPGAVRQGGRPAGLDPFCGPGRVTAALRTGPGAGEPVDQPHAQAPSGQVPVDGPGRHQGGVGVDPAKGLHHVPRN